MRILLLNPEYPPIGGGAGNAARHLAQALVRRGHSVRVVTAHLRGLPRRQDDNGVQVWRIPALRRRADRSGAVEQAAFVLAALPAVVRQIYTWQPRGILAFFGAPSGIVTWLLHPWLRVPYVVALRGGDVPGFRPYDFARYHRLLAPLLRRVWRQAAAVVANSQGLRTLAQRFAPEVPIAVIPNGVDPQRFRPPSHRAWLPPRLLFVGRLVYQKGLDVLLQALAALPREQDWHLTLVGDGPYRATLEQQATTLGLRARLTFVGWQPPERIPTFYAAANLFVFPSRDEGMPNAVLEAMAAGLPVVATAIAGNEELLTPQTGRLVPPGDADALRATLHTLLPEAEVRQTLGAAARQRVLAHYTWDAVAEQYEALLERIVSPSAPATGRAISG